jgi:hypothetical protein
VLGQSPKVFLTVTSIVIIILSIIVAKQKFSLIVPMNDLQAAKREKVFSLFICMYSLFVFNYRMKSE